MKTNQFFEYYHGHEADQFTFYRIPKQFFKDKSFAALSDAARILYGLLLDRMSLSARNGWIDENDHVFIIYTIEQIREDLGWGRDKAINALAELDSRKGIGLIERVKRGLGKPDIIFVKNFASGADDEPSEEDFKPDTGSNPPKKPKTRINPLKSEKSTSRSRKTRLQEVGKPDFKRSEKPHLFCRVLLRQIWT